MYIHMNKLLNSHYYNTKLNIYAEKNILIKLSVNNLVKTLTYSIFLLSVNSKFYLKCLKIYNFCNKRKFVIKIEILKNKI